MNLTIHLRPTSNLFFIKICDLARLSQIDNFHVGNAIFLQLKNNMEQELRLSSTNFKHTEFICNIINAIPTSTDQIFSVIKYAEQRDDFDEKDDSYLCHLKKCFNECDSLTLESQTIIENYC